MLELETVLMVLEAYLDDEALEAVKATLDREVLPIRAVEAVAEEYLSEEDMAELHDTLLDTESELAEAGMGYHAYE
jgi:hypothetical protein